MGDFFPSEYKQFPFQAGDLLVHSGAADGEYSLVKILRVDRVVVPEGASINILGEAFTATEEDELLVVSSAYAQEKFASLEEARAAVQAGAWTVKFAHVPSRAPGAGEGQVRIGHEPVADAELVGYWLWREAFDKGEAGIF